VSYLKMLGLTEEPFNTADSKFFFTSVRNEEYQAVLAALNQKEFISLVVGESGVGKTALLNYLFDNSLNEWRLESLTLQAKVEADEILEQLLGQFHVVVNKNIDQHMYRQQMLSTLSMRLNELALFKLMPIILVDNAEYLDAESLKIFFDLNKLNEDSKGKLKIVLFGQPEVLNIIQAPEFVDFRSQFNVVSLENLSLVQLSGYLRHRLLSAGYNQKLPFDSEQIDTIFAQSQGNPARINEVAHQLLVKKISDYSARMETSDREAEPTFESSLVDQVGNQNKSKENEMTYKGNDSKTENDIDDLAYSIQKQIGSFDEIQNLPDDIDDEQISTTTDDLAQQLQEELAESQQFLQGNGANNPFLTAKFLVPGVAIFFILISSATYFLLSDDSSDEFSSQPQITSQPLLLPEENVSTKQETISEKPVVKTVEPPAPKDNSTVLSNNINKPDNKQSVDSESEIKKIPLIFLDDDLLEVVDAQKSLQTESNGNGEITVNQARDSLKESKTNPVYDVNGEIKKTETLLPKTDKPLAVDFSHNSPQDKKINSEVANNVVILPKINGVTPSPIIGSNSRQSISVNGKNFHQETQLILNWGPENQPKEKVFSVRLTPSQFKYESEKLIRLYVNTGVESGKWQVQAVNSGNAHSSIYSFEVVQPFKKSKAKTTKSKVTKAKTIESKKLSQNSYLLAQPNNYYTIQLLSSSNLEAVKDLTKKYKIADKSSIVTIQRNGKRLYSLVYGSFRDKKGATKAYKKLPKALSKNKLWARKISDVKKLMGNSQTPSKKNRQAKTAKKSSGPLYNEQLIASRDPKLWTFQLISLGAESDMNQYIKNNKIQDKANYFKRTVNGKSRYTLVYGVYESRQQAQASLASLPKNIRAGKPWIRQYADIQALMKK